MSITSIEMLRRDEKEISNNVISKIRSYDPNAQAIYLPNVDPNENVDYIFITMEPSFGKWARTEKNAKEMINKGFRNFLWSKDDFIFHFSIYYFLSKNYYITDISKVAVLTTTANETRGDVYQLWTKHLLREIDIIGGKGSKIFYVGNIVEKYLKNEIRDKHMAGKIIHYSVNAGKKRKEARKQDPDAYTKFFTEKKEIISEEKIFEFAENLLRDSIDNDNLINSILERLKKNTFLTESRKELMFTYYLTFSAYYKANPNLLR